MTVRFPAALLAALLAGARALPGLAANAPVARVPAAPGPSAATSEEACARLTLQGLSGAEARLGSLAASAEAALAAHGTGSYPGAMKQARDQFTTSRDRLRSLHAWLSESGLASPHVSSTTAAYNVAGYAREALGALDLGRHWASVATAYDRSALGKKMLQEAAKAHAVLADLESDGLACYVSAYVP